MLCCALAFGALPVYAATSRLMDSSQLDLSKINSIEATRGIPVGTVIVWSSPGNPDDADKWLECDGRSTAGYPELAAIVGGKTPDYNNQFLRGGIASQVGQVAADSMRSHAHRMDQHNHTVSGSSGAHSYNAPASGGGYPVDISKSSLTYAQYKITCGGGVPNNFPGTKIFYGHVIASGSSYWGTPWITVNDGETCFKDYAGSWYTIENNPNTIGGNGGATVTAHTSGGSISGVTSTSGPTSTHAAGGAETAPQHIRVRYLIRALP